MGFDVKRFVSKVSEDRKCSLCHLVLDNPVKTPCSHVFCSGCILPWVVRYGVCPLKCQALEPADLDNVLPLRDLVLNMKVLCDFKDQGCSEIIKLRDFVQHSQECGARPVKCRNSGCECKIPLKELHEHEDLVCGYKTSEICKKGCGLLLLEGSVESHECLPALHQKVAEQKQIIATLEEDIENLSNKFEVRESSLIQRIAMLTRKLQMQSMQFQNQLRNCQTQLDQILAVKNNNNSCDSKVIYLNFF